VRVLLPRSRSKSALTQTVTTGQSPRGTAARGTASLSALTGGTPANPTTLAVDSKVAASLQIGATYRFDAHWFADATVLRTFLKTRTTLSTGQTLDTRLDPTTIAIAVGYAF